MSRSLLSLFCLTLLCLPVQAGHSGPKLLFRIHVQTTGQGLSDQEAIPITLTHPNENILVRALPEITENDILTVQEEASGTRFYFNHEGKVALDVFTAQNQGRAMVVLLNSEVIYAPIIDEEITTGQLLIPKKFKPEILEALKDIAEKNTKEATRL